MGTSECFKGHLLELLIAAQGGIHRWNRPIRDVIARKDVIEDGLGPFLVARFFHAKAQNGLQWCPLAGLLLGERGIPGGQSFAVGFGSQPELLHQLKKLFSFVRCHNGLT